VKEIQLTQGQVALVSDHWFDYLNQFNWYAGWNAHIKGYYAYRTIGKRPNRKKITMHSVVAQTPKGMLCDHINHKTLDNQEENLRNTTYSQSNMNRRAAYKNRFGIAGISQYYTGYTACLYVNKKRVLNKTFPTLQEAINARKTAEREYFGEFASAD
jgi:hypothetical protein